MSTRRSAGDGIPQRSGTPSGVDEAISVESVTRRDAAAEKLSLSRTADTTGALSTTVTFPNTSFSEPLRGGSKHFIPEYIRRMVHFQQMDFEYAVSQMVQLIVSPSRLYRTSFHSRKWTKNQWARDDPAFVVVLAIFLIVASVAYAVAFRVHTISGILSLVANTIVVDFLGLGFIISTAGWFLANSYLRNFPGNNLSMRQDVEWLYCFDIHCNSFVPLFIVLYVVQFFLTPFLMQPTFIAGLIANTMYAGTFSYYFYITFCGYVELEKDNILKHSEWFLCPIVGILVLYSLSILFSINFTVVVMNFYFS